MYQINLILKSFKDPRPTSVRRRRRGVAVDLLACSTLTYYSSELLGGAYLRIQIIVL